MQSIRNRRWNALALMLAYVVAFQSGLSSFGVVPVWAGSGNEGAQLCRGLAVSDQAPDSDHDADHCKIICASGACTPVLALRPSNAGTNLHLPIRTVAFVGRYHAVFVGEQTFTPLARGPPLSSV